MTIRRRRPASDDPTALPKTVAQLRRDFEQDRASLGLRASTLVVRAPKTTPTVGAGEQALVLTSTGGLATIDETGTETAVGGQDPGSFLNGSFEEMSAGFAAGWSTGGSAGATFTTDSTDSVTGTRSIKITLPLVPGFEQNGHIASEAFDVPPGSTVTVTAMAKTTVALQMFALILSNEPGGEPDIGAPGTESTFGEFYLPTAEWSPRVTSMALPATHTRARLRLGFSGTVAGTGYIDSVIIQIEPTNNAQIMDRIQQALRGGGRRAVTTAGHVSWSEPFTATGVGITYAPGAVFPPDGTVIPVYASSARTSTTVTAGKIDLRNGDTLWAEIPLPDFTIDSAYNLRIVGELGSLDPDLPIDRWLMVCTLDFPVAAGSIPVVNWCDGRTETPWMSLPLANGWLPFNVASGALVRQVNGNTEYDIDIKSGTLGATAFTFPAKFQAANDHVILGIDGASTPSPAQVFAAGPFVPYGANNTRWRTHI